MKEPAPPIGQAGQFGQRLSFQTCHLAMTSIKVGQKANLPLCARHPSQQNKVRKKKWFPFRALTYELIAKVYWIGTARWKGKDSFIFLYDDYYLLLPHWWMKSKKRFLFSLLTEFYELSFPFIVFPFLPSRAGCCILEWIKRRFKIKWGWDVALLMKAEIKQNCISRRQKGEGFVLNGCWMLLTNCQSV